MYLVLYFINGKVGRYHYPLLLLSYRVSTLQDLLIKGKSLYEGRCPTKLYATVNICVVGLILISHLHLFLERSPLPRKLLRILVVIPIPDDSEKWRVVE